MHLQAVSNWLTVFAAAGHFKYLRSAHCYLQQMSNLEEEHPDVYRKFLDGFHVVRRSNQCCAGLSSDLVIEQMLMKSLKSTDGLTPLWDQEHSSKSRLNSACSRSRHCTTTLVGEATYLLILLLHYSQTDNEIIYFRSDANKQSKNTECIPLTFWKKL